MRDIREWTRVIASVGTTEDRRSAGPQASMFDRKFFRSRDLCVVTTQRRYKGRVYAIHLLRRSYREDGRARNETLDNLSHLPAPLIEVIRRALRGALRGGR